MYAMCGFRNSETLVQPIKLVKVNQTCEDISFILERCILDGHDCKTNLYKGDIDTKL